MLLPIINRLILYAVSDFEYILLVLAEMQCINIIMVWHQYLCCCSKYQTLGVLGLRQPLH